LNFRFQVFGLFRLDFYTLIRFYSGFGRCDDDFVDRLSRHYSVLIFSIFVLIISSVQFVGKPISCFTPASFTDAHITYADFVCWISNTYFFPIDQDIPEFDEQNQTRHGSYMLRFYQYVPFILLLQTIGFFLPGFFWRNGLFRLGLTLQKHIDQLKLSQNSLAESPVYRRQLVRNVASRLDQYFRTYTNAPYPRLTLFYLFIKCLYMINILLQLLCLHFFMRFNLNFHDLFERLIIYSNTYRQTSIQFPTNVLCDFIVRFLGKNQHRHTVQCVLPINIFNEKIFIFAYLWLIFLLICNFYNLIIQWVVFLIFHRDISETRQRRIRRTQNSDVVQVYDYQPITKIFSQQYLKSDGTVLLRLLDMNIDLVTMNDLLDDLWDLYKAHPI